MQRLTPAHILHEDDDLLVLSKPPGLLSQKSLDPTRPYLMREAAALLQELHDLSSPPYLAIHHRLDRDTSGVIVLSRSKRANKPLMQAFKQRLVKKTYLAISSLAPGQPPLSSPPTSSFEVKNHLATQKQQKGEARGPAPQVPVFAGGDFAHTSFQILGAAPSNDVYLVKAHPTTGRRHQIRAHLSGAGLPILADTLYGGPTHVKSLSPERVMLHAYRIELPHPVSQEVVQFTAPPPHDFLALLDALAIELPSFE